MNMTTRRACSSQAETIRVVFCAREVVTLKEAIDVLGINGALVHKYIMKITDLQFHSLIKEGRREGLHWGKCWKKISFKKPVT